MNKKQIFLIFLRLFYWFCRLFGVCPFHYNSRKNAFDWSKWEILYSIIIWANFSYFYPTSGLRSVVNLNRLVVISYFYLAMGTITFVFIMQWIHVKKFTNLLNETKKLLEEFRPFCAKITGWDMIKAGFWFICKIVITSGIAQIASIVCCVALGKMMYGKVDYFVVFIVSVSYFLQTLVPNMFYTFILGVSIQYHQLNIEIEKISHQANYHKKYSDSESNELLCKLSKRLDYIATLHGKLTVHTTKVNKLFSAQLLIVIGNFVAVLLIEVKTQIYF